MFLRILTAAASKKYGKGTKWCISKKMMMMTLIKET